MRKKKGCLSDNPDCFNCPFPDCYATLDDINRQNACEDRKAMKARNKVIVEMWNSGVCTNEIGKAYNLTQSAILKILKKERKNGTEVRKP